MIAPTDEDVGRKVIYRPNGQQMEWGEIARVTERFVFVLYFGNLTPAATRRADLEWDDGALT